jgi:hypothetical protein
MKNLKQIAVAAVMMLSFSAATMGQSATAAATATIITPITITNTADLAFGNLFAGATGGTAVISPAGARSVTGDVTIPGNPGTFNAAAFTVNGQATWTYAITLPAGALTISSGANTMTVDVWTSNPSGTGTLDGTGAQTLTVGATLNVGAAQAAGAYTSGATPFTVTVNYN